MKKALYLLDTNIIADLVKNPDGKVQQRIQALGEDAVCTSVVVAAELRYGVAKKGSARLTEKVELLLKALNVLPFETPADIEYGRIRAELEAKGQPIGGNDLLIAAHASSEKLVLVTTNVAEFERIDGLAIENWLA